jgi:hypothetical protein
LTKGLASFVDGIFIAPEDSDNIFNGNDKKLVVVLEVDRDSVFGVEEDFVVLPQWHICIVFDGSADRNDSAGNRGDFGRIGERDASARLAFWLVFSDQHPGANWFDVLKGSCGLVLVWHGAKSLA